MAKKLIGVENLESAICQASGKLYADGSIILTAGAKDELRKRGIAVVYGKKPGGEGCCGALTAQCCTGACAHPAPAAGCTAACGHPTRATPAVPAAPAPAAPGGGCCSEKAADSPAPHGACGAPTPSGGCGCGFSVPLDTPAQGLGGLLAAAGHAEAIEPFLTAMAGVLREQYGVTDPRELETLTRQVIKTVKENI